MTWLRRRIKDILDIPSPPGDRLGATFDVFITTLIALNAAAVVLETVGDFHERYGAWLRVFELVSIAIFSVEYVLRLWVVVEDPQFRDPVSGRLKFALTPMALVDLLAILPALLAIVDLRVLRVLRLVRLIKLGRYSESMRILVRVVHRNRQELAMSSFVVFLALVIVSSLMYYVEHDAQPEAFASIPHAMWWGIVALTTTGYGDVTPVTTLGRLLGGLTAILGVGVIALPVGILASGFVEEINARRKKTAPPETCPHCGKSTTTPLHGNGPVEVQAR